MAHRFSPRAFTLIELLVVIAIIALLVGILLPALGKARNSARLTQSMSNVRAIATATETYRTDHKSSVPYQVPAGRVPATWSYGGKCTNIYWATQSGGAYDFAPATRPLNPYIYPEIRFETGVSTTYRTTLELPVFKSPGDKATHQRDFPNPTPSITAYDDVGSSYQYNGRWYNYVDNTSLQNWSPYSFRLCKAFGKMCDSSLVNTSTFVMYHDQAADVLSNDTAGRSFRT